MVPSELTIGNIVKATVGFLVGLAQMLWVSLIRPYPLFWFVLVVAVVALRLLPRLLRR